MYQHHEDHTIGAEADFGAEHPIVTKAKAVGFTAGGAVLGAVAGPVGIAVGAGVGGAIDLARHLWKKPKLTAAGIAPAPHVAVPHLMAMKAKGGGGHVTPKAAVAIVTTAAASPPPEATALYQYLKAHPFDAMLGSVTYTAVQFVYLVKAFQTAYNGTAASKTTGPLGVTGDYDGKTASALVLFTHDDPAKWNPPFGPDPNAG